MIIFVTGVPGSGKTLRTMHWLSKPEYSGRQIYSNINADTQTGRPADHLELPDDWRTVPDGSVVVIDEAQHKWPTRGPSKAIPEQVSALDTHRHRGVDFILTTQRPTGVDHHVRGLVGLHEHVRRKAGLQAAVITSRAEAFDPKDTAQLQAADQFPWKFPKEFYGQYKSSVEHTGAYKFRMPFKTAFMIAVPCTLFTIVGVYALFNWQSSSEMAETTVAESDNPQPPPSRRNERNRASYRRYTEETVTGCVITPDECYCFDADGYRVVMHDSQCRNASRRVRWSGTSSSSSMDPQEQGAYIDKMKGKTGDSRASVAASNPDSIPF